MPTRMSRHVQGTSRNPVASGVCCTDTASNSGPGASSMVRDADLGMLGHCLREQAALELLLGHLLDSQAERRHAHGHLAVESQKPDLLEGAEHQLLQLLVDLLLAPQELLDVL